MITLRPAGERGHANHGWLDTYHTFSFDSYYDPRHMGFRSLRVINEDVVQPSAGFPNHGHRDMEILTYVLEGELTHRDSTGGGGVIRPGDVQHMSAGSGVQHSEYNQSSSEAVHLLQIWIKPERAGIPPSYEQKNFPPEERLNRLQLVAARGSEDGALPLHQNAKVYASLLEAGRSLAYELAPGRHAWLQVARGEVTLNGTTMKTGDGAAISKETELKIAAQGESSAEFLLFDLA